MAPARCCRVEAAGVIDVVKQGQAWTVVRDDGELIRHTRVAAVHKGQSEAVAAARRYAALTGERLAPSLAQWRAEP